MPASATTRRISASASRSTCNTRAFGLLIRTTTAAPAVRTSQLSFVKPSLSNVTLMMSRSLRPSTPAPISLGDMRERSIELFATLAHPHEIAAHDDSQVDDE